MHKCFVLYSAPSVTLKYMPPWSAYNDFTWHFLLHTVNDIIWIVWTGWHGELCEIAVQNQCTHEPCENNATCIGTVDDYRCICPPGYTGHHCEVNIDDCQFKPCKNGVCVDLIGGHQCYCTPGEIDSQHHPSLDIVKFDPLMFSTRLWWT